MSKPVILHPPRNNPPPVTLLTDFGLADGYVGAMKGVIIDVLPWVKIIDITHAIPPQDVRHAAFVLYSVAPYFPECTVHLVVVDPGVGTKRRAIAVYSESAIFIGPDNGVFSWIYKTQQVREIRELTNPYYMRSQVSETFHGRDLFAPFAAHIASGVPGPSVGPVVSDPVQFEIPDPTTAADGSILGQVLHIDGFGNIITNIPPAMLTEAQQWTFELAGVEITDFLRVYGLAQAGKPIALIGSLGFLEIAIRNSSAARYLDVQVGDVITARAVA
jgi:S-adenosylmethionine hydrolase